MTTTPDPRDPDGTQRDHDGADRPSCPLPDDRWLWEDHFDDGGWPIIRKHQHSTDCYDQTSIGPILDCGR